MRKILLHILLLILVVSCSTTSLNNRYLTASPEEISKYKHTSFPFASGTKVHIRQGAFGKSSHSEPGNEYLWDLEVPFGTPVYSVEDGVVIGVWQPGKGGKCSEAFSQFAHNIKIEHSDGTVAQYVHINSKLQVGKRVRKGEVIAVTAENGWICYPHLHFGIYSSRNHLYDSPERKTIPLFFEGIQNGLLNEGKSYLVP